jgi:hypothetical protein
MKKILTFILFVSFSSIYAENMTKSGYLEIKSSREGITIKNVFRYSLKVAVTNRKVDVRPCLGPSEEFTVYGNFSPRLMKNTVIACNYNDEAFNKDQRSIFRETDHRKEQEARNRISDAFWVGVKEWLSGFKGIGFAIKVYDVISQGRGAVAAYQGGEEQFTNYVFDFVKGKAEDEALEALGKKAEREGINKGFAKAAGRAAYEYYSHAGQESKYPDLENYLQGAVLLHSDVNYRLSNVRFNAYHDADYRNFKTVTPRVTLSVEPLCYGSDLNEYWKNPDERLFKDEDKDNELEWAEGAINATLGGSVGIAVSPEIWLNQNTPSRLYGEFSYHQTMYSLNPDTKIKLSPNFFSKVPTNSTGFTTENEPVFFQQRYSFGLSWRFFIGKGGILDLNGGYDKISSRLDLSNATLSQGYTWSNDKIDIVQDVMVPHYGIKLGYGLNKFRGILLSCGAQFYDSKQENQTTYKLIDSNLNKPISFSNNQFNYRLNVGLTAEF